MGPILIFDKSTLQSLSPDESVWLDNFFLTNITPLFFIETLADLENEIRKGRSPAQVVGSIAYKTPDTGSKMNAHHTTMLFNELIGNVSIDINDNRPRIPGGKITTLGGESGVVIEQSPEEEAFHRWQKGEFLDLERQIAKQWRNDLINTNYDEICAPFKEIFTHHKKPTTLTDIKIIADMFIRETSREKLIQYGLGILGISDTYKGRMACTPYTRQVVSV